MLLFHYTFTPIERRFFPDLDKFHALDFLHMNILETNEDKEEEEFDFTILVGHNNHFKIIKLTFSWGSLLAKEHPTDSKVIELQERFISFSVRCHP